jgi:hypothetical protein
MPCGIAGKLARRPPANPGRDSQERKPPDHHDGAAHHASSLSIARASVVALSRCGSA